MIGANKLGRFIVLDVRGSIEFAAILYLAFAGIAFGTEALHLRVVPMFLAVAPLFWLLVFAVRALWFLFLTRESVEPVEELYSHHFPPMKW